MTDPRPHRGSPNGADPDASPSLAPIRLDALLADPAVWAEPPAGIVDALLVEIAAEASDRPADQGPVSADRRFRHRLLLQLVAGGIVLVALVGVWLGRDGDDADPVTVALAGTDLAPAASAVATVDTTPQGLRIVLDVVDLEPAAEGSYYEAWVRNADGGVAAGTFHLRGGDGVIELWAGVSLDDYPRITVTLQREGAGPESSGEVVLAGELAP